MSLKEKRTFLGRFKTGEDLLGSINELCKRNNIELGVFYIIGAVSMAKMGYYDQNKKKYVYCVNLKKKLEITSCMGNISKKESEIFAHAHITLADHEGKCYGGHLMPGTKIFAAEYYIKELTGKKFIRKYDPITGLMLW